MGLLYRTRRRGVFGDREVGFAREPARARELSEWVYFYFVNRGYLRALRCAKVGRYRIRNLRVYTRSNLMCTSPMRIANTVLAVLRLYPHGMLCTERWGPHCRCVENTRASRNLRPGSAGHELIEHLLNRHSGMPMQLLYDSCDQASQLFPQRLLGLLEGAIEAGQPLTTRLEL